jgi:DNA-binding NarL/FixJ family response regulator
MQLNRTHLHVLLVEDDPMYAAIARTLLDEQISDEPGHSFEIVHVGTIGEALGLVAGTPFDCALVDLGLPDSGGAEGTQRLLAARPGLPIIVLTADRKDETQAAVAAAGAQGYVMKGSEDENTLWSRLLAAAGRG